VKLGQSCGPARVVQHFIPIADQGRKTRPPRR
jgi:hypothetical protein